MITWAEGAVVHHVTHVNPEKRAARLMCNRYVEFWPADVTEDLPVTCLTCIAEPPIDVEAWRTPILAGKVSEKQRQYLQQNIQRDVDERGDEVVFRCGERHGSRRTSDARCAECGYP
jgi:hypothetical protein